MQNPLNFRGRNHLRKHLSARPSGTTPRYPVVLFDLDHTLFDFELSKTLALTEIAAAIGYGDVGHLRGRLSEIEAPLWRALEAGELGLETLNDQRWAGLVDALGLDADATRLAGDYLDGLGRLGGLLDGARELLDALEPVCRLGLVTNGYGRVQRPRLEHFDLARYFEAVTISGEIGVAKPADRFFDVALAEFGHPERAEVLVVGDSLTSDMAGGIASGLATCWYNAHDKAHPEDSAVDHVVADLASVEGIVLGH